VSTESNFERAIKSKMYNREAKIWPLADNFGWPQPSLMLKRRVI
jgi:hypothetical protein